MIEKKYIFGSRRWNMKYNKICIPQSYRKSIYNKEWNEGRINPKHLEEDKLFTQIDLMYIKEMNNY